MPVYLDLVILLNILVDFFLLLGTNRLSGYPNGIARSVLAAVFGGLYAGACLLPGFSFLGNTLWRLVSLIIMAIVAFGWNKGTLQRCVLFVFLSMALGGIAMGVDDINFGTLLLAAIGVAGMCIVGFRGKAGREQYIPVELVRNGKRMRLTALYDTGNNLKDPITGQQVLVAGADIAQDAVGLTRDQLADPIGTMASAGIPGLRLIPYRAVGKSSGMLLAVRFDEVRINGSKSGDLVAFAPDSFGRSEVYQALTGGVI